MKIVYIVFDGLLGTVFDSQVLTLLVKLKQRGISTDLVVFNDFREKISPEFIYKKGKVAAQIGGTLVNSFVHVPYMGRMSLIPQTITLYKHLRQLGMLHQRNCILHCRGQPAAYMGILLKRLSKNIKVFADLRGALSAELLITNPDDPPLLQNIKKSRHRESFIIENVVHKGSDRLSCVSYAFRRYLEEERKVKKNISVIPTFVDTARFKYDPNIRSKIRFQLGYDRNHIVVVYNGSASVWQRPEKIVELAAMIVGRDDRYRFLVLSRAQKTFEALVSKFPLLRRKTTIMCLAYQDVGRYLQAGDWGMIIREQTLVNRVATPTKFAEYLRAGLKIIATEGIGDVSRWIRQEDAGFVLNGLDKKFLLELQKSLNVFELCDEEKVRLSKLGESFSVENYLPEILNIYKELGG